MKGHDIAIMVGPPGKSSKRPPADDGDMLDPEEAGESDDDEAAEESVAEEFQSAVKDGTPKDVIDAFKKLMDVCG